MNKWYTQPPPDQNKNEDNRVVSSGPQSTTSVSSAVNTMQQIEIGAIGKTTEIAR